MYGLARDIKEVLLGRQPEVTLLLPLFSSFISFLVCFCMTFSFFRFLHVFVCFH